MKKILALFLVAGFIFATATVAAGGFNWGGVFKGAVSDWSQSGSSSGGGGTHEVSYCGRLGLQGWLRQADEACRNGYDVISPPSHARCRTGTGYIGAIRCR